MAGLTERQKKIIGMTAAVLFLLVWFTPVYSEILFHFDILGYVFCSTSIGVITWIAIMLLIGGVIVKATGFNFL